MRIPVTKPFLPSREDFKKLIDDIWDRQWLTNNGPLLCEFESGLKEYLKVQNLHAVTSGTIGLQLALKSLPAGSEVITTPFSYVATTSALVWEGLIPVFADISPESLNIDPKRVRDAITNRTSAILATHVYGNPCEVEELERIAGENDLVVIYDAAHAFGTRYRDRSILDHGDFSVLSFHATKMFHTINGGAVIAKDENKGAEIARRRNFGHIGVNEFDGVGINAKVGEIHAAIGLLNLAKANELIDRRRTQWMRYREGIENTSLRTIALTDEEGYNASYFPILFESPEHAELITARAARRGMEFRRYFSPALNKLDYVEYSPCPIAEDIAQRVCCLPLYHELTIEQQSEVLETVLSNE